MILKFSNQREVMREKWDSVFCSPKYFVIKSSSEAQPVISYLQQFLTLDKPIPRCPSLSRHFRVDLLMLTQRWGFPCKYQEPPSQQPITVRRRGAMSIWALPSAVLKAQQRSSCPAMVALLQPIITATLPAAISQFKRNLNFTS